MNTKVTASDGIGPDESVVIKDGYVIVTDGTARITSQVHQAADGTYTHVITVKGCMTGKARPLTPMTEMPEITTTTGTLGETIRKIQWITTTAASLKWTINDFVESLIRELNTLDRENREHILRANSLRSHNTYLAIENDRLESTPREVTPQMLEAAFYASVESGFRLPESLHRNIIEAALKAAP